MENPEEILHSLEEFSKMKPKDIPRELEEYLCFVAKTGNPVYQWPTIKSLFREKLLSVITEFYESCSFVEMPQKNLEMFNYDAMKNFILEKLDTFASAPFTVQRICELLTTPRKEYSRIDKYMRALEKNILVVSTTEPGRRSTENGEGIMNGIESEHLPESSNSSHDINVEEMDESPSWSRTAQVAPILFENNENENQTTTEVEQTASVQESFENGSEAKLEMPSSSTAISTLSQVQNQQETVITCRSIDETQQPYVSIEPVVLNTCTTSHQESVEENEADSSVTITAVPAGVQQRRNSVERVEATENISADAEAEVDTDAEVDTEEIKDTIVPELVEQKLPEKEEEVETPTLKEQVLPTVPCPEPVIEPTTEAKIVVHSEETTALVQEESGIENISPENSSSSPETLQIDMNQEPEKNESETVETIEDQPQSEEKENISEATSNWPEETKESQVQEERDNAKSPVSEVREAEANGIISRPESTEKCVSEEKAVDEAKEDSSVSQTVSEAVVEDPSDKISSTAELIHDEQIEDKEADPVSVPPVSDSDCKVDCEETPMEVDIVSETEVEKKEEFVSEEPSSTSEAAAL